MKIDDILQHPHMLQDETTEQLYSIHWRIHQLVDGGQLQNFTRQQMIMADKAVYQELVRRGEKPHYYDIVKSEYYDGMSRIDYPFLMDYALVLSQIAGLAHEVHSILDIGAGTGRFGDIARKQYDHVECVDLDPLIVETMKAAGLESQVADVLDLPYEDDAFDVVTSIHSLEHVYNAELAVQNMVHVAKQSVMILLPLGDRADPSHVHSWDSMRELKSWLDEMLLPAPWLTKYNPATNTALVEIKKGLDALQWISYADDFVVLPDFISVSGSAIDGKSSDTDIIWRAKIGGMETAFRNVFPNKEMTAAFDHHLNESGPHSDYVPLYDLVAVRKKDVSRIVVNKKITPLKRFKPLKTGKGYTQQDFYAPDQALFWANGYFHDDVGIVVEKKYNGYRCIFQKDGDKSLIYFADNDRNRSESFGPITDEFIHMPFNKLVLDTEIGGRRADGRVVERIALTPLVKNIKINDDGTFIAPDGTTVKLVVHVFDCLYADEPLSEKTWKERRAVLEHIFHNHEYKYFILRDIIGIAHSDKQLKDMIAKASALAGSEGAVLKAENSSYPQSGQSMAWAKVKNVVEMKVKVVGRKPVANAKHVWNYNVVIAGIHGGSEEHLTTTFNTKIDAKDGDILTLRVEEVIPKQDKQGKWHISVVVPMVSDIDTEQGHADSIGEIISRAYHANILQSSKAIISKLMASGIIRGTRIRKAAGNIDFKPGMHGEAIIQTHERGLTHEQVKYIHDFGWKPIDISHADLSRLSELLGNGVKHAIDEAAKGNGAIISKMLKALIDINEHDKKLVAKYEPVSIHTDFRMRPDDKDWWEGGEGFTPGNQYKPNKFMLFSQQSPGSTQKIMMNFKVPKGSGDYTHDVIKGPLTWMYVGDKAPKAFPPGAVGSTKNTWSRFTIRDRFEWTAGIQDEHYKEFWFNGHVMRGRWIIQYVPLQGRRVWMISRPIDQKMKWSGWQNEKSRNIISKKVWKRLVTGVVLKPNKFDLQKDFAKPEAIERAAHNYMIKWSTYNSTLGIQHEYMDVDRGKLTVVESYIAPQDLDINGHHVVKGTWLMTVKVMDDALWNDVLTGKLQGFSIQGWATKHSVD